MPWRNYAAAIKGEVGGCWNVKPNAMTFYLGYFTLNYILELVVARLCLPSCGWMRLVTVMLILNLVTHPLLWLIVSLSFSDYWSKLLLGEVLAFAVEALLGLLFLGRQIASKKRIILTILACNLFSFMFTFIV